MEMEIVEVVLPCYDLRKGKYDFPCVSGLCPYGLDVRDCYMHFNEEIKELFNELFNLRAEIAEGIV